MYINDTHIMYYAVVAILGLFVGMFVDWMNSRIFYKIQTKLYINVTNISNICSTSIQLWNKKHIYSKFRFNKIYDINTNVIISICNRLQITNNTKQTKPNNV